MDQKERFFTQPLDRTPYQACAWVAFFAIIAFLGGVWLVWSLGSSIKKFDFSFGRTGDEAFFNLSLPDRAPGSEDIRTDLENRLNGAKEEAIQAAQESVQEEAKQQIQERTDNLLPSLLSPTSAP